MSENRIPADQQNKGSATSARNPRKSWGANRESQAAQSARSNGSANGGQTAEAAPSGSRASGRRTANWGERRPAPPKPTAVTAASDGSARGKALQTGDGTSSGTVGLGYSEDTESGESPQMAEYEKALKNYKRANSNYQNKVKKAEEALERARKEHADAVKEARRLVDKEREEYAKPVDKFGRSTLYTESVTYGKAELKLESAGIKTMIVAPQAAMVGAPHGTCAMQSKQVLDQVLASQDADGKRFIEVRTSVDTLLIPFDEKDEQEARFFASRILTASENLEMTQASYRQRIANFEANVKRIDGDTAMIDTAKRNLSEAKADTHDLESARTRVDFTRAAVPTLELEERDRKQRRKKLIIAIVIAALIAIAVLVIVLATAHSAAAAGAVAALAGAADDGAAISLPCLVP